MSLRIEYVVSERGTYVPVLAAAGEQSTAFSPRIVWRTRGGGDAETWDQVKALIKSPNTEIYIDEPVSEDTPYHIPATSGVTELQDAYFASPGDNEYQVKLDSNSPTEQAVLNRLRGTRNVVVTPLGDNTTGPQLTWTGRSIAAFFIECDGANAGLVPGSTGKCIQTEADQSLLITLTGQVGVGGVNLGPGSSCFVLAVSSPSNNLFPDGWVTSTDGTASLTIVSDGSGSPLPASFTGFTGTLTYNGVGQSSAASDGNALPQNPVKGMMAFRGGTANVKLYYDGTNWCMVPHATFVSVSARNPGVTTETYDLAPLHVDSGMIFSCGIVNAGGLKVFPIACRATSLHEIEVTFLNLEVGATGGFDMGVTMQEQDGGYG